MLESPLAPYLLWAKSREPAPFDLAGSNLLPCSIDDLPGARGALDITAPNDNGYAPLVESIAAHYGIDPVRIVPASGCSGANFVTVAALVGAGDDVLVERPGYDPLVAACRLMGARVRRFDRRFERRLRAEHRDHPRRALAEHQTRRRDDAAQSVGRPHRPGGARRAG